MSDDIVTRLRERGEWDAHPMGGREWFPDELCEEAADEIERLNLVMVHLDKVCNLLVAELLRNSDYRAYTTTTLLQEFVYRAVRGD